jgi:hypothetical protein
MAKQQWTVKIKRSLCTSGVKDIDHIPGHLNQNIESRVSAPGSSAIAAVFTAVFTRVSGSMATTDQTHVWTAFDRTHHGVKRYDVNLTDPVSPLLPEGWRCPIQLRNR